MLMLMKKVAVSPEQACVERVRGAPTSWTLHRCQDIRWHCKQ
jgi:hypothetical protein